MQAGRQIVQWGGFLGSSLVTFAEDGVMTTRADLFRGPNIGLLPPLLAQRDFAAACSPCTSFKLDVCATLADRS